MRTRPTIAAACLLVLSACGKEFPPAVQAVAPAAPAAPATLAEQT